MELAIFLCTQWRQCLLNWAFANDMQRRIWKTLENFRNFWPDLKNFDEGEVHILELQDYDGKRNFEKFQEKTLQNSKNILRCVVQMGILWMHPRLPFWPEGVEQGTK